MHKPFAVVARFFDYIIEPTIYERGRDVFVTGTQLDFPNVLYRRGPIACGAQLWREMLAAFVTLMRTATDDRALERFMTAHRACLIAAGHPLVRLMLEDVPDMEEVRRRVQIDQPAGLGGHDLLDPVPTMLIENCVAWPDRLDSPIHIVHDESNVVRRWTPLIRSLSQADAIEASGSHWGAIMPLPLRVASVDLVQSHGSPLVQLADIVGGASITWLLEKVAPGNRWTPFAQEIDALGLPAWIENEIWPMPMTPFSRFG